MNTNAFSLCIDESTDNSTKKLACLVSRVCLDFQIYDFFFGLIDYQKHMIGFPADVAPNMTGKHNSVASHIEQEISNLFILKCVCHSLAHSLAHHMSV